MTRLRLLLILLASSLLLSGFCMATNNDNEAGTSTRRLPEVPIESLLDRIAPPSADTYIKLLNPIRISGLNKLDRKEYAEVPFNTILDIPIYTTKSDVNKVEQALKDFNYVAIVDPAKNQASKIKYGNMKLVQEHFDFEELNHVLLSQRLHPNVHILVKHLKSQMEPNYPINMPDELSVEELPHANGIPILTHRFDELGYMLGASLTGPKMFYHMRNGHPTVLIQPQAPAHRLVRDLRRIEENSINQALTNYGVYTRQYDQKLASIFWGAPIPLDDEHQSDRMEWTTMLRYPRFGPGVSRDEMKDALQKHGKFRFYNSNNRANSGPIKVKLLNPNGVPGTAMLPTIERLSAGEKATESFYEWATKLRRPG
ncbi:uncharacterized protein UTRI_04535 [Ustilago trichophora]|uniref:Effector family protein Eff1 n=1 Tax=Ustilago trichophora TaxID=86804 RepID=A0A5C3EG14_9BASI|nr:uncharacterized protein UTRI_04535 [Ustilago trichophora]